MKYPSLQYGHVAHIWNLSTSFNWASFLGDCNSPWTPSTAAMCLPWETKVRRVGLWIGATQRWNKTPYIQQRCRWSLCCSTAAQRLSLPSCGHDLLWVRDLTSLVGQSLLGVLHKALSTICIMYSAWSFDGDSLNEFFDKVLKFIRNAGLLLGMTGPGNLLVTPDKEQKPPRWVFVILTHFKFKSATVRGFFLKKHRGINADLRQRLLGWHLACHTEYSV